VSARGKQDLQDLFRPSSTEISYAERPRAVLDFKRAEQTDHRAALATIGVIGAHEWFDEANSPRIPVSVLNVLLQLLIGASGRALRVRVEVPAPEAWVRWDRLAVRDERPE
jgi:hypothetical protein